MPETQKLLHGSIDPYAPGGLAKLFAHHRATFGDAVMEDNGAAGGDAGDGTGGSGTGNAGTGGSNTATGTGSGAPDGGDGDEPLGAPGKKALDAERDSNRQLKKDLADRDARIKALEDATKTDEQKREQELEELRGSDKTKDQAIADRDLTILKYQVAAQKNLDLEAAERLRGATKEEIEKDADAWVQKWGNSNGNGVVPGAGTTSDTKPDVAPGLGRLRNAYESKKN
ncbi:hypothetical protein BJH93_04105 [Kocuria polaris]|nr:hypothetical protein [Kocuria polaris]